jgi:proteasome lid subunit RPN8/RPN11
VVIIHSSTNRSIIIKGEEGHPHEVCGYLIGKHKKGRKNSGMDDIFIITDFMVCENINSDRPDIRFEISPKDHMAATKQAEKQKLDVVGVYHSHPNHKAYASPTDNDYAVERTIYLIYSIFDSKFKDLKAYILNQVTNKLESTKVSRTVKSRRLKLKKIQVEK